MRFALARDLAEGMAYLYALRACAAPCARYQTLAIELDTLTLVCELAPVSSVRARPTPTALLDMQCVQVLDALLAGCKPRAIAEGVFGAGTLATQ